MPSGPVPVDRNAALQVGQGERLLAVAAVGRADQIEQRLFSEIGMVGLGRTSSPPGANSRRTS